MKLKNIYLYEYDSNSQLKLKQNNVLIQIYPHPNLTIPDMFLISPSYEDIAIIEVSQQ